LGGRLIVVSGTGTGIGKTHFSEALLAALRASGARAAGVKPVETGLSQPGPSDALRLKRASSFHVKHSGYRFAAPVSPHVAARETGQPIRIEGIAAELRGLRSHVDVLLVELAGGLFSPLSEVTFNAHLALALQPDSLLLVAPDRLGVLHDVLATTRAAAALSVVVAGAVLMAAELVDSSTGRNAAELVRLGAIPRAISLPRGRPDELAARGEVRSIAKDLWQEGVTG